MRWQTGFLSQAECHVTAQGPVLVVVASLDFSRRDVLVQPVPTLYAWQEETKLLIFHLWHFSARKKATRHQTVGWEASEQPDTADTDKETSKNHQVEMNFQGYSKLIWRVMVPFYPPNKVCYSLMGQQMNISKPKCSVVDRSTLVKRTPISDEYYRIIHAAALKEVQKAQGAGQSICYQQENSGWKAVVIPGPRSLSGGTDFPRQRGAGELGMLSEISPPPQIYQVSSVQAKGAG